MTEQPLESHNAECRRWWAQCRKMKKWLKFQLLVTKSRIERRQLERHMELETRDQRAWAAARLSTAAISKKSREKQFAPAPGSERHWGVVVTVDGEEVLHIETSSLSGVANIEDYAEEVRTCGYHLLAFIGRRSGASPNDPKLSDGGGQAWRLPVVVRWWRSLAAAVTGRSRSLQRMVRRRWIADDARKQEVDIEKVVADSLEFIRRISCAADKAEKSSSLGLGIGGVEKPAHHPSGDFSVVGKGE